MSYLPTVEAINQLLFIEDGNEPADLAFVPGDAQLSVMDPALEAYRSGLVKYIVVSGQDEQPITDGAPTECELMCRYALERGVPEEALIREDRSTNTLENILFTEPLIEERLGWRNVRTVAFSCKNYHARRLLMTASRHWPEQVRYLFWPVEAEEIGPDGATYAIERDGWWHNPLSRERVLAEVGRIATYTIKGDIGDF